MRRLSQILQCFPGRQPSKEEMPDMLPPDFHRDHPWYSKRIPQSRSGSSLQKHRQRGREFSVPWESATTCLPACRQAELQAPWPGLRLRSHSKFRARSPALLRDLQRPAADGSTPLRPLFASAAPTPWSWVIRWYEKSSGSRVREMRLK